MGPNAGGLIDFEIVKHGGELVDGLAKLVEVRGVDPAGEGGDGEVVELELLAEIDEELCVIAEGRGGAIVVELKTGVRGLFEEPVSPGEKALGKFWIFQSGSPGGESHDGSGVGARRGCLEFAVGGRGEFRDLEVVMKGWMGRPGRCLVPDPKGGSVIPGLAMKGRFLVLACREDEGEQENEQAIFNVARVVVVEG